MGATGAEQSAAQPDGAPARQPLSASYLVDRYLERGWSSDRIAADTGWSGQYVRDRLREHQIPLRRRNESPPGRRADHAQVLTWLAQGAPVAEVAHRSGYTPSGIYALLQRNGRPAPGPQPRPRPIEAADVGALYRQGLSLAAIGDRYGRSADWARARVLAAGTPLRGGGRRPVIDPAAVHHGLSEGLPLAKIAQRLDCHPETVRLIVIAQGWPVPARRPRGRVLPLAPSRLARRLGRLPQRGVPAGRRRCPRALTCRSPRASWPCA